MINELPISLKKLQYKDSGLKLDYLFDDGNDVVPTSITYDYLPEEISQHLLEKLVSVRLFAANIMRIISDRQMISITEDKYYGVVDDMLPQIMKIMQNERNTPLDESRLERFHVDELVFGETQSYVEMKGIIYESGGGSKFSTAKISLDGKGKRSVRYMFYEPLVLELQELEKLVFGIINMTIKKQENQLSLFNRSSDYEQLELELVKDVVLKKA